MIVIYSGHGSFEFEQNSWNVFVLGQKWAVRGQQKYAFIWLKFGVEVSAWGGNYVPQGR